jgi:photosystem II stability/assembly factor-like uncharacterized protein
VSEQQGWALVDEACGSADQRCAAVYGTHDGGAHWERLAVLNHSPAAVHVGCPTRVGCVSQVWFSTAQIGFLAGPGFYATRDGGRTWVPQPAQDVSSVTGDSDHAYRLVSSSTGCPGPCATRLETATPGSTTWVTVRSASQLATNGFGDQLLAAGSNLYVVAYGHIAGGTPSPATLHVSRDQGRTWARIADPCGFNHGAELDAAHAAATQQSVALLCVTKGGGPSFTVVSRDAARTFRPRTETPFADSAQIALCSDGEVAVANAGVTGGGRFTYHVAVSADGGQTWPGRQVDPENVTDGLLGGHLGCRGTHTIEWIGYPYQLWQTTDAGLTWIKPTAP